MWNKKEKTNIAILEIAILVLEIILLVDLHFDYQWHQQQYRQDKNYQELILEERNRDVEYLKQVNHQLEQILNIVEAH